MQISNPLTVRRGDLRYVQLPLPSSSLMVSFAFSDVLAGSKSVGTIKANQIVGQVVFIAEVAFNGGLTLTIGDAGAQGRLMTAAQNTPSSIGAYEVSPNYQYLADTEVFVYFPGGSPTTGSGIVIIYLA